MESHALAFAFCIAFFVALCIARCNKEITIEVRDERDLILSKSPKEFQDKLKVCRDESPCGGDHNCEMRHLNKCL